MAEFRIQLDCCWEKSTKTLEDFKIETEQKTFNKITVAGDDYKYDYVEGKEWQFGMIIQHLTRLRSDHFWLKLSHSLCRYRPVTREQTQWAPSIYKCVDFVDRSLLWFVIYLGKCSFAPLLVVCSLCRYQNFIWEKQWYLNKELAVWTLWQNHIISGLQQRKLLSHIFRDFELLQLRSSLIPPVQFQIQ